MRNMGSADEHPEVVSRYLEDERQRNRIAQIGSSDEAKAIGIHCSPFGVIHKNRANLILNLSSPEGCQ